MSIGFLNPDSLVAQVALPFGSNVADLGCGSGFYTVAASRVVGPGGRVYAVDIQDGKLSFTQSAAHLAGLANVTTIKANLTSTVTEIPGLSCDLVVLASILHEITDRKPLLANSYRLLKTGGKLLVVEWKKEVTPFGPELSARLDPSVIEQELVLSGFRKTQDLIADSYHYAMLFIKQ